MSYYAYYCSQRSSTLGLWDSEAVAGIDFSIVKSGPPFWITFATCLYTQSKIWGLGRRFRRFVGVLYWVLLLCRAAKLENEDSAGSSDKRNAQDGQKTPLHCTY